MILLHGAYGKHYATKAEAEAGWESGTDFAIAFHNSNERIGKYCSIRDLGILKADFGRVVIAYGNDNHWEL